VRATLRWMASNSALIVLSLILAVLAWIVAVEKGDPTLEERYPQAIPVALSNLPEGMVVLGEFDEYARVTVRAPESVWNSIEVDDFVVVADLTDLGTGDHRVPIQLTLDRQPSQIVSVDPEYVTLQLEPEAEQTVPVRVQVEGEPTLGYIMHTLTVTPSQVMVNGPSTYVAQVVEAVTQVSVQDVDSDVDGEFQLRAVNRDGLPVSHVTLAHQLADVRIPIELSLYYRPLVVRVTLKGQFAPGYRITEISVSPPSVTVFGNPGVIAALPGYIETEPIDLEGADTDVVERPALNVPSNVSVVLDEQPLVRVAIEPIQSSATVVITPELQGLEPGFTATVSPETVAVILSGPMPLLETLETDDVRIMLDVFGLLTGTHQIEPQVVVPEGVTAQSVNPATVQVEIFAAITPTLADDERDSD
jgi:YbbR domain-containing protein